MVATYEAPTGLLLMTAALPSLCQDAIQYSYNEEGETRWKTVTYTGHLSRDAAYSDCRENRGDTLRAHIDDVEGKRTSWLEG